MNLLLGQILNGIATGMLYALMGLGLSLITGVLNIPNFAHGALFAVGAYLLVTSVNLVGDFWLGLLLAPRMSDDRRRNIGWTLVAVGILTTLPLATLVLRRRRNVSG